ncbi:hypothetical protein SUGI_0015080 [Cryptomeria japonica]|nr:hypothetical protein SUGI_0015080 [Cryptomeria japonica]
MGRCETRSIQNTVAFPNNIYGQMCIEYRSVSSVCMGLQKCSQGNEINGGKLPDPNGEEHLVRGSGLVISKAEATYLVEEALDRVEKVMEALEATEKEQQKDQVGDVGAQDVDFGMQEKEGGVK